MYKKIGIVITDGVGFRNFILSDFIAEAEATYEEVIIYSCLPVDIYEGFVTKSKIIELPVFEDNFYTWFFLKCKEVAHLQLYRKGNFGIQDNYNVNKARINNIRGYAKEFIFFITRFLHSESWIQRFNRWQQFTFKNSVVTKTYQQFLLESKVDFLFFTHQRPPYIAPLIYASEQLKIKNGTFIFSWDNLASKGRMSGNFDYYFVWSALMKSELQAFYQKVGSHQIKVVGTPQFEPYVLERYEVTKAEFLNRFNINSEYKTICFSCGDVATSRNDTIYIEAIAEAIVTNQIADTVNFLVRTSPAETPERFEFLKEKYPFITWNYPKWELSRLGHQETWSQRVPTVADMKDLRSILQYCDVFINMCSTMSLDAMCFDKPVINPVFGNKENGLYDDQRFLNYQHYKNVVDSGAVAIAKNAEELIKEINVSLKEPTLRLESQKQLLDLQISRPLLKTGKRIVDSISECK